MIVEKFKVLPAFNFMREIDLKIFKIYNITYKYIFLNICIEPIHMQFENFQVKKKLLKSVTQSSK